MKFKALLIIYLYITTSLVVISQDSTPEELEFFKNAGIITQEEYEILGGGSNIVDGKYLYELRINGVLESKIYEVLVKDGITYFPVIEFFNILEFNNYSIDNNEIKCFLGEDLEEKNILPNKNGFWKNNEFYLSKNVFEDIFLKTLKIDNDSFKINMFLNFSSPKEIKYTLDRTKEKIQDKKNKKNLIYTNEPVFFELGYLRTKLDKIYKKDKNSGSDKFKNSWDGSLEYQGAFLYGQIITNYNLKEHNLEDIKLLYNNLWEQHNLEFNNYSVGKKTREWGASFKKDKGYFVTKDKSYIIKENVPIGSRVELLFMGIPIAVQDAINGTVYFANDEIKGDREYILKIHTPDGKIYLKKIDTASDYNQQNKGQIEYNIDFREVAQSNGKIRGHSKVYYGLTENTTIGLDYTRDVELIDKNFRYINSGKAELIHSNYIFSYPYTIVLGKEKSFTKLYDKGKFQVKGQIDIEKFRLKVNKEKKEKYYREKDKSEYTFEYRPWNNLTLKYEIENRKFYDKTKEENRKYSGSYSKSFNSFLISGEYENSTFDKERYMLNCYYSGFRTFTIKLENEWKKSGKEYDTAISIFNNSNDIFDYSLELRQSKSNKSMVTFRFNLQYDNWFNLGIFADKKGNQNYKFGLDRIIDLKNPKKNIENIDSTRVKVITFVDENNNNQFDKEEEKLKNIKVKIGKKEVVTNENGEGIFYGIPNHMIYDLKVTIRRPAFTIGKNKIQIKGRNNSTLVAYIPIKPMMTLTGKVNLDINDLKTQKENISIYRDILIKIKDSNGKILEMSMCDEEGIFQVSELLPNKYKIEIEYIGENYKIDTITKEINLKYDDNNLDENIDFNIKVKELE